MADQCFIPQAPYEFKDVTLRFATRDDMWPIYATTHVSVDQKDDNKNPQDLNQAHLQYNLLGKKAAALEWNMKGAAFMIANVPADRVSLHIPDHHGNAIGGICMTTFDPKAKDGILHLEKLFAIRTQYPLGSILLDQCITMAQNHPAISSIRLNAPFPKSRRWYQQHALFQEVELDDAVFTASCFESNYLSLDCKNFNAARAMLHDHMKQIAAHPPKPVL